jgi:hypothetical protein
MVTSGQLLMVEAAMDTAAGLALAATLLKIYFKPRRNLLETRLLAVLINLLLIVSIRGIDCAIGVHRSTQIILFCFMSILPLSGILFTEGLMRRHAPLFLKIFGVVGAAALCAASLNFDSYPMVFFSGLYSFQILVFAALVWLAWNRSVDSLSESENRTLLSIGLILFISLPLLVSDFRIVFDWPIPRMGALATLLFTVTMVKLTDKASRRDVFYEIAYIPLINLFSCLVFCIVWLDFSAFFVLYPLLICFHLLIIAVSEILFGQRQVQDWIFTVIQQLDRSKIKSFGDAKHVINSVMTAQTILLLSEKDLVSFDLAALKKELTGKDTYYLRELRKTDRNFSTSQLIYLLESHQMTEIHLVSLEPLHLILVNNRNMGFSSDYQKELGLLRHYMTALTKKTL